MLRQPRLPSLRGVLATTTEAQKTSTKLHTGLALLATSLLAACGGEAGIAPEELATESRFGSAVAISETHRFVGAAGHVEAGAVFVFDLRGSDPTATIVPFQGSPGDGFGSAIDATSEYVAVGAPVSEVDGIVSGRAFIYSLDESQDLWLQSDDLLALSPSDLDYFGASVSIDGDVVVVGSPGDDERGSNAGAAFVYRRDGAEWSFVTKLLSPDAATGDRFGESVEIVGEHILVGSPYGFVGERRPGAAYLFTAVSESFDAGRRLDPPTGDPEQRFGSAVALVSGFAFVGAPGPGNEESPGGTVSTYRIAGGTVTPGQVLTIGPTVAESGFGAGLAALGDLLLAGSQRPVGDHMGPGTASVFSNSGGSWELVARLTGPDPAKADGFGAQVALGNGLIAVGASGDATNGSYSGMVYFFSGGPDSWR